MDDLTLIFDSITEQQLPKRFRTVLDPWKQPDGGPSRRGLKELHASGSEQPTLSELAGPIRGLAPRVTVVDLRQESHALMGEHPVSWYGMKNWANAGRSLAQVLDDESGRTATLAAAGEVAVARVYAKDASGRLATVRFENVNAPQARSEELTARSLGLGYFRIPVKDHARPSDEDVDRLVLFLRDLPPDTWLHFHCHAGDGRTTTFLLLHDMLRNAKALSMEDMVLRQHLLGGVEVLNTPHQGWKAPLYLERAEFVRRFYDYARSRDFRSLTWSEHLAG